ncbi:hypothetical protein MUK42_17591 [Musa troglodytarum]|uniref:Uncharacterized protein n=1 Tax=Musa troglodytarum TaxID=320322 RepID=A0A9E7FZD3_9LILI|nr:hypothetical protein MUK42_17591 [Musa troglodytarum]
MRINEILGNQHDESDALLLESLRRLRLMELSVDVLKVLILHSSVSLLFYVGLRNRPHTLLQEFDDFRVLNQKWFLQFLLHGMLDVFYLFDTQLSAKLAPEQKAFSEAKVKQQRDTAALKRKPPMILQDWRAVRERPQRSRAQVERQRRLRAQVESSGDVESRGREHKLSGGAQVERKHKERGEEKK